jgi:hypothetical protein
MPIPFKLLLEPASPFQSQTLMAYARTKQSGLVLKFRQLEHALRIICVFKGNEFHGELANVTNLEP